MLTHHVLRIRLKRYVFGELGNSIFFSIQFNLFSQAQEGCSERPIGHLMSAAPNRIETCTGKFVAMVYKDEQTNTLKHTHQFTNMMGKSCFMRGPITTNINK